MERVLKSPAQNAATMAWAAPLIAFIFSFFSRNIPNRSQTTNIIVLGLCVLFYLTGLASGIVALRKGAANEPGVKTPAIIGIGLSLLCLLLVGFVVAASL